MKTLDYQAWATQRPTYRQAITLTYSEFGESEDSYAECRVYKTDEGVYELSLSVMGESYYEGDCSCEDCRRRPYEQLNGEATSLAGALEWFQENLQETIKYFGLYDEIPEFNAYDFYDHIERVSARDVDNILSKFITRDELDSLPLDQLPFSKHNSAYEFDLENNGETLNVSVTSDYDIAKTRVKIGYLETIFPLKEFDKHDGYVSDRIREHIVERIGATDFKNALFNAIEQNKPQPHKYDYTFSYVSSKGDVRTKGFDIGSRSHGVQVIDDDSARKYAEVTTKAWNAVLTDVTKNPNDLAESLSELSDDLTL